MKGHLEVYERRVISVVSPIQIHRPWMMIQIPSEACVLCIFRARATSGRARHPPEWIGWMSMDDDDGVRACARDGVLTTTTTTTTTITTTDEDGDDDDDDYHDEYHDDD